MNQEIEVEQKNEAGKADRLYQYWEQIKKQTGGKKNEKDI